MENSILNFDFPVNSPKIIKVIGVGGGGGNAVKHMFKEGIHDVTFVLCNTDVQALQKSEIPVKLQLGPQTTFGLGAGNDPEVARKAAEESEEDIRNLFRDGTQMAFITAGMGGGTGTGAAPVVARIAKEEGILTVGIVTIPFLFEKRMKIVQALNGVERMRQNVDALLVINNEKLREIYTDGMTTLREAYAKADSILSTATKSIAEVITTEGIINLDFRDVRKILKDGGVAIMSMGTARGENRLKRAIENALNSPLLNNNDITKAKKILFNIVSSPEYPARIDEMNELDTFMENLNPNIEVIWGQSEDASLEEDIKFIVLATGFGKESVPGMMEQESIVQDEVAKKKEADDRKIDSVIKETYGDSAEKQSQRTTHFYIFRDEDLENEELINMFEEIPTYLRSKSEADSMKNL